MSRVICDDRRSSAKIKWKVYKTVVRPARLYGPEIEGGSRIFIGGCKGFYVRERTLRAQNSKYLSAGLQGPLKGPGSSI